MGHAFLIGLFIGIAVFAAVKKGFGFLTLLPLFIAVVLLRKGRRARVDKQVGDQRPGVRR